MMILQSMGDYLAKHKRVSARDLAREFQTSEDAIDAMLGVWMRKGKVKKITECGCSGGCCGQRSEVFYLWQVSEHPIGFVQVA